MRLAQLNRFDSALSIGRSLKVDMTDAFAHLTSRCLLLNRDEATVMCAVILFPRMHLMLSMPVGKKTHPTGY